MRKAIMGLALAMSVLASPALAQRALDIPSGTYVVEPTHASITWRLTHMGLSNYVARFTKFDSTVDLDAADPTKSKLNVVIDARSLRTDFPKADQEFTTDPRFLNTNKFPEIRFVSRSLRWTGENRGQLTGDLTLLGVTKPVTLDVTLNGTMKEHPFRKVPMFGISATGKIRRSDFGMNALVPMVGDEVELLIEAEYEKK